MTNSTIDQKLRQQYEQLTPRERLLADFILAHPQDLALFNTAELARMCGVSKATVSRLFKRLGFSSFREGRTVARQLRQQGVPVPENDGESLPFDSHLQQETFNLNKLFKGLEQEQIDTLVEALSNARQILIIGYRNSYPLALHLRQQLLQIRPRVRLAPEPGQSIGEELVGLDATDLVVLFGFRRRPKGFEALLTQLLRKATPLALIADSSLAGEAEQANWWIKCPLDSRSAFDSYAAPMCLMTLIANRLLHHCLEPGRERISAISQEYSALDELSLSGTLHDDA